MTIRKLLLSALAIGMFSVPVLAQDTPPAHDGPGMDKKFSADTDGDGFLSKAEFMAVQEKRFAEMDKDSDGKVSKDEMKAHRETMKEKFKEKRKEWSEKLNEKKEEMKDKIEEKKAE